MRRYGFVDPEVHALIPGRRVAGALLAAQDKEFARWHKSGRSAC